MPAPRRSYLPLLLTLVVLIFIADQISKAWFVFKFGSHHAPDFLAFAQEYFTLWAGWDGQVRAVTGAPGSYGPFAPAQVVWDPWLRWNLVTNTGAAWSMFTGNSLALSGVSAVMAAALAWVWGRYFRYSQAMTWAFGAIIGGALGNFADRFRLHEVVDFIDVKLPLIGRLFPSLGDPYDFPIFNVADSCAVCGTIALALYLIAADIRHLRQRKHVAAPPPETPAAHFDPFQLSEEEKAARVAEMRAIADSVRSGEQFTPRSETGMPLGLAAEERHAQSELPDPESPLPEGTPDLWDGSNYSEDTPERK